MAKQISYRKQKVNVTSLLQNSLKQMRKEFNKRGDTLSKELGKGASYISQLENGKIKEIEYDFLLDIFHTITGMSEDPFMSYFIKFINSVISSCKAKESLLYEYWIHIFVVQDVPHPITPWIKDFIENKLSTSGHTPEDLVQDINRISGRRNSLSLYDDLIPNKAYLSAHEDRSAIFNETFSLSIYASYNLDSDYILNILNNEINSINYMNMQAIFETLFLFDSSYDLAGAYEKTLKIMKDNQFYDTFELFDSFSLGESLNNTKEEAVSPNEFRFYDDLVLNYREKYSQLKDELFEKMDFALQQYYSANHAYSCEVMEVIMKNLNTDPGLVLALLSSPLHKISLDKRHFFMDDYRNLIDRYSD